MVQGQLKTEQVASGVALGLRPLGPEPTRRPVGPPGSFRARFRLVLNRTSGHLHLHHQLLLGVWLF